jgi:DNA primase
MIPQETVSKILDTAQIVDVVEDFVSLKRRGANYIACCPFHNEKTPSFYVSPAKGIYKCFGCGKSGTAIGFVMEHENLSYPEALKYLARKYGIEVKEKEETAEEIALRQRSDSLLLV